VRAVAAGVDHQVGDGGEGHAADRGHRWDRQPAPLAQLAEVELALGLEPDLEEEQRHQPLVDPAAQVGGQLVVAEGDRQARRPHVVIGAADVGPHERHQRGADENDRAAGLGVHPAAHRRAEVALPGGAALRGRGGGGRRLG
jgi:hypothetical protein